MRTSRVPGVVGLAVVAGSIAVAMATNELSDWSSPVLIGVLVAFAIIADRFQIEDNAKVHIVGSLPAFVLAAVLLGPGPALIVGLLATLAYRRSRPIYLIANLAAYSAFPVVTALFARTAALEGGVSAQSTLWLLVVVAAFLLAWLLNFAVIGAYARALMGRPLVAQFRETYAPLFSSQLVHALLTAALAWLYGELGLPALVLAGVVLATYQRLQRDLLQAQRHAEEAREQTDRLARTQVGIVRAMVDSVHARDRMTARHSAAVARYARRIAQVADCTPREQDLVHTAGLLHDVGKFIFSDQIFWSAKLTDEEWELVKRHPEQGAEIVRRLEGHEEVAEIILAHHERIDGRGYPRGLAGEEIPRLARMISIADTYDVMTARDSYREPIPPEAAIAELRRVSGAQLDAELVELFVTQVLDGDGLGFRHNDDADFEAELDFERRVRDYVSVDAAVSPESRGS